MFTCNCTGKNEEQNYYSFSLRDNGGSQWIIFMSSHTGEIVPGVLDLQLVQFSDDTLRITNMYIDDFSFRSKGIIEAVEGELICGNYVKVKNKSSGKIALLVSSQLIRSVDQYTSSCLFSLHCSTTITQRFDAECQIT